MKYVLGIDVGTGSARAGLFDLSGRRLGMGVEPIRMWRPRPGYAQQSGDDIWRAVCKATKAALAESGVEPRAVVGLGFDATCSMAVVDRDGEPVSIDPDGDAAQNVIVWMDHRAHAEADLINEGDYDVLRYVGGRISPEMQTPKLLWLKEHMPEAWRRAGHFFDLPDYLTWRCTGSTARSLCSTVCKWTYLGHESDGGWDADYFRAIGLGDLDDERFERIGTDVRPMGEALNNGLTAEAAQALGLEPGTAVGVSIIDAHAGGLGVIAAGEGPPDFDRRLALIGGTSSCHMVVSLEARFVEGVWGPYYSAMIPGLWLNEGGQSATGSLIDRIVFGHASTGEMMRVAESESVSPYAVLNARLYQLADGDTIDRLTEDLHVDPDFHGNRSPWADASLRGTISGLRLEQGLDELALLYLATIQAVAYGTRHIIERLNDKGYAIDTLAMCGGGTKNPVFLDQHANATGCTIELPQEPEAVLLGAATLGAVASGEHADLPSAMSAMSGVGSIRTPDADAIAYHDAKYIIFNRLHTDQLAYRDIMRLTAAASATR